MKVDFVISGELEVARRANLEHNVGMSLPNCEIPDIKWSTLLDVLNRCTAGIDLGKHRQVGIQLTLHTNSVNTVKTKEQFQTLFNCTAIPQSKSMSQNTW